MNNLYLIVEASGTRLAIPATDVTTVMICGTIVRAPKTPSFVAGLAAMRSDVITVVDPLAAIQGGPANISEDATLVAVSIEGHFYGLAVDDVIDAIEVEEAPGRTGVAMAKGWHAVSIGVIDFDGETILVIDTAKLVGSFEPAAA